MSMAKFDTVETPENHEVKPPEVIEDTESIKSGDGEIGIDSEIENFAKMGEDETSNETSNETKDATEDSEMNENPYADGMSEADKEAYGISSEIEDFVRTGQMDDVKLPSEMQNEGVDVPEGAEKNENPYAEGMSEADKESYGISSEIEDFVKTGQIDEFKLPSEMQEDGADVSEGGYLDSEMQKSIEESEKIGDDENVIKIGEDGHIETNDKDLRYGIGHNDLSDIESWRDVKIGESMYESSVENYNVDTLSGMSGSIEAMVNNFEKIDETKAEVGGINEDSEKMQEYVISQGHKADYVEDFGPVVKEFENHDLNSEMGERMEMNTSFEQDGPTLQETWNTDVDNVAYDQNDDE